MGHLRSTRIASPFQTVDYQEAPAAGFYLTVDYQDTGGRLPSLASNSPNGALPEGIGTVLVGRNPFTYVGVPGASYSRTSVPSNSLGKR